MKQIAGQLAFSDYLNETLSLGYVDNGCGMIGPEIPFARLGEYIGKKILISSPRESSTDYKIVIVTSFRKDGENVYRYSSTKTYEIIGKASRIGFTDDNRRKKENSWVSELYCTNGRYKGSNKYQSCMYEINREEL